MAQIEIRLPKMGESVTEATITNWLKNIGDSVAMDEPLVEVATDKVDNELPSEAAGTLIQILFEKDQVAQVGDVIAILSTDGSAAPAPAAPSTYIFTCMAHGHSRLRRYPDQKGGSCACCRSPNRPRLLWRAAPSWAGRHPWCACAAARGILPCRRASAPPSCCR